MRFKLIFQALLGQIYLRSCYGLNRVRLVGAIPGMDASNSASRMDALATSVWLALRAACGCANRLSCRFVTACPKNFHPLQVALFV